MSRELRGDEISDEEYLRIAQLESQLEDKTPYERSMKMGIKNSLVSIAEEKDRRLMQIAISTSSASLFHDYNRRAMMSNWTVVRVWLPNIRGHLITPMQSLTLANANIGHVSLEISHQQLYASYWPKASATYLQAVLGKTPATFYNLEQDKIAEGSEPDVVIVLYGLNVKKMGETFMQFKQNPEGHMWGLFENAITPGRSCASLVYHLLNVAGIQQFAAWGKITEKVVVTPSDIAHVALEARKSTEQESLIEKYTLRPPSEIKEAYPRRIPLDKIAETESQAQCVCM